MIAVILPSIGLAVALLGGFVTFSALVSADRNPFATVVPESWRRAHRAFAWLAQYAWQPCPLCDQPFGGHEWRDIDGKTSLIPNPASIFGHLGICPACTRARRGHRLPVPWDLPDHYQGD